MTLSVKAKNTRFTTFRNKNLANHSFTTFCKCEMDEISLGCQGLMLGAVSETCCQSNVEADYASDCRSCCHPGRVPLCVPEFKKSQLNGSV